MLFNIIFECLLSLKTAFVTTIAALIYHGWNKWYVSLDSNKDTLKRVSESRGLGGVFSRSARAVYVMGCVIKIHCIDAFTAVEFEHPVVKRRSWMI